jgi:sugar lactone lactonase YvrE/4-amino-4-deoxy-L-arabinose transferase-like glycosyltransferase
MSTAEKSTSLLDQPISRFLPKFNIEMLLVVFIILMAVVSRFYALGDRTMAHDEVNHVVPSYSLYQGNGYQHDPVTHGPFQFHIIALTFFLIGDNDFSARTPAALFSIAAIIFVLFAYRRYLGHTGALIAGFLFLISPYMLFYGRYVRNEGFIELFAVVMLYAVLRYLEKGDKFSLYLLVASVMMHFVSKETSFIYSALLLLFLGSLVFIELPKAHWSDFRHRNGFLTSVLMAVISFAAFGLLSHFISKATANGQPVTSSFYLSISLSAFSISPAQIVMILLFIAFLIGLVFSARFITTGVDNENPTLRRSLDMLLLVGSLVLPQLAAFPISMAGWNPLNYDTGMAPIGIFLTLCAVAGVGIGLSWNPTLWLGNAAMFYSVYTVLYTTFFTNGRGFFTGIIGSLGYWLSQQGVQRGSQPDYYYILTQLPVYEFLAVLGLILGIYFAVRYRLFSQYGGIIPADQRPALLAAQQPITPAETSTAAPQSQDKTPVDAVSKTSSLKMPVFALLVFWSIATLLSLSVAGEKMPWLTVHIALPMLLAAGWGLGFLVDSTPWKALLHHRQIIAVILVPVFLAALVSAIGSILSNTPPFQGNTLDQLSATSTFLFAAVAALISGIAIFYLLKQTPNGLIVRLFTAVFFIFMAVLTIRTSYRANYVLDATGMEYLVYAHATQGPKEILSQVEEISQRTTGGTDIVVAYDNDGLYPYWWYLRDYPNHRWFGDNPTSDLRDVPLIIASDANWSKLDSILRDNYVYYEYIRLVWPNQDYFNLTWDRVWYVITNPGMRQAVWDIWFNRDYTLYGQLTNDNNLTQANWQPSAKLRLYIRKDVVSQIWNYGILPATTPVTTTDPYASKMTTLLPDQVISPAQGSQEALSAPRSMAFAKDGSIYVADSRNNRIVHFSTDGKLLNIIGSGQSSAENSSFNEPWGVAVGPNGSIYVADTWNNRIQKFSADGTFVATWGQAGLADTPFALYGPRGIAVDQNGHVFVTDTGNKRVVVYDSDGKFITQFGSSGVDAGQFDEPVGIALGSDGKVYVDDTWNQRIQVFAPDQSSTTYTPVTSWDVSAWYGNSTENKPFLAVDSKGDIFTTDPENYRVLEFGPDGTFIQGWGNYSQGTDGFGLASGIAIDSQDHIWVSDGVNNDLLRFTLPAK